MAFTISLSPHVTRFLRGLSYWVPLVGASGYMLARVFCAGFLLTFQTQFDAVFNLAD